MVTKNARTKKQILSEARAALAHHVGAEWRWEATPWSDHEDGHLRTIGGRLIATVRAEEDGERILRERALLAELVGLLS